MAAFIGVPALAFGAKVGPLKYAQSNFGNVLHATSPVAQTSGLRAFQQALESGAKGLGANVPAGSSANPEGLWGLLPGNGP